MRHGLYSGLILLFLYVGFVAGPVRAGHSAAQANAQTEIAVLRQSPQIQKALSHILALEPQSQKDLIELTEIPAPPFKEERRASHFARMLRASGADTVTVDEVGNVIAERKGTVGDRIVVISAHMDTVFPEGTNVTVRIDGDRLYAPGIGDDTRGLVVLNTLLKAMSHAGIRTKANILFVGTVGEEGLGNLRGVRHLFRSGARPIDAFIAIDGGAIDRIVNAAIGSHRYRIVFEGAGGHSWGDFGDPNPHHAMGRVIALFDDMAAAMAETGEKISYNVGRIGGGTSINSIPFKSWAEVDLRSGDPDQLDALDGLLHRAVRQALDEENKGRFDGPELTVRIESVGKRPAGKGSLESALLNRMWAALETMGYEPKVASSSTDANIPISLGIPAISISRGGAGGGAHSPCEWWQNDQGHKAIEAGLLTLIATAELSD